MSGGKKAGIAIGVIAAACVVGFGGIPTLTSFPDLRQIASSLSLQPSSVPYKSLRSIWIASDPKTRPALSDVVTGSHFILKSPQPRAKSFPGLFLLHEVQVTAGAPQLQRITIIEWRR